MKPKNRLSEFSFTNLRIDAHPCLRPRMMKYPSPTAIKAR
jgi:hypothetical protein